jgi:hypothetical protein
VKKNKVKVEVFVPFGSCTCTFAPLLEKVGRVTSKFKDTVEVQMRSTNSKEAQAYGIRESCVIVDYTIKMTTDFDERKLEAIIQTNAKSQ